MKASEPAKAKERQRSLPGRRGSIAGSGCPFAWLPLRPFFGGVLGAGLGIEAVGRISVEELARYIRPELLEDGTRAALGGHRQPIGDGLAKAGVAGGIVEIEI